MTIVALRASLARWRAREAVYERKERWWAHGSQRPWSERKPCVLRYRKLKQNAVKMVAHRRRQIAAKETLGERALREARKLIGVMEQGGNNMGREVLRIIRANGGTGPEPWCGDFVAYVYRAAGSKVVQRAWAAVRYLGFLTGMGIVKKPRPGDIVCFGFDHTGVFVRWLEGGNFLAIEGNTGRTGAVSDSRTGGDGVYEKRRHRSQVSRFVRVYR